MNVVDNLLATYARFGIDLTLDRVLYLLKKLGNPQNIVPIIHVAGTNGKGSVCAFLSTILTKAGYRTGRYTSPHLVDWCERISINNRLITPADLLEAIQVVQAVIEPQCMPTQFEVITCAMWWYFAQQRVDIAVIETGLGGRLDATNVCDTPLVAAITSISRDHWQRLGDSLAQIATEKAGIIKANCPVVIGKLPEVARSVILARAQALLCPITEVTVPLPDTYDVALPGVHQRLNAAIAVAVVQQLRGWHITEAAIYQGLAHTKWQGRLEWTTYKGKQILLDGAHNVAGAETLRHYLDQIYCQRSVAWIIGILATKDYSSILHTLVRSGDYLFPIEIPGHHSVSPAELVAAVSVPIQYEIQANLWASLDRAITLDFPIVICGSLYLLGEFKRESDRGVRHGF